MRLKKIQISGFKTFPEKTEFNFDQQLTVIIGPNGSGKSNISDAIKWVLGEQSAKNLRGQHMNDVIFNGTSSRKALSLAEVNLHITNDDNALPLEYPEVQLTRQIFKNGEGRYFINKKRVRLKEITNAFLDTGIGARAYSIIEQGQIDKFISSSSADRRLIFEEAAGIMKYKKRKQEALRNLEKVAANLVRIEDRIVQLEKQAGTLKRQSSKARRYKRLKEELLELKKTIQISIFRKLLSQKVQLEKDSGFVQTEFDSFIAKIENKETQIQQVKLDLLEKEEELKEIEGENFEISEKVREIEKEIATINERLMNIENLRTESNSNIIEIENKVIERKTARDNANTELNEIIERTDSFTNDLKLAEENYNKVYELLNESKNNLTEFKDSVFDLLTEKASIENKITSFVTQKSQLQINIDRYIAEIHAFNSEVDELKKEKDSLLQKKEENEAAVKTIESEIEKFTTKINEMNEEFTKLSLTLEEKKNAISRIEHELKFLKDMTDHYEGYYEGVRRLFEKINKDKENFLGIIDVLANLITVKKDYITAIESTLGGALQYVVTENMNDAQRGIEYLKRVKGGRVTFLPIENYNWVEAKKGRTDFGEGFLCLADEVVECEDRFKKIITKFLHRTLIVDTFENAIKIKRQITKDKIFGFKIVTLDGEVIFADGRVSGGKLKEKTAGFLSRRYLLKELNDKLKTLIPQKEEIEEKLNRLENETLKLEEEKEFYLRKSENTRMQLIELNSQFSRNEEDRKRIGNNIDINNSQISLLQSEIDDLNKEITQIQETLDSLNEKTKEIEENIEKFEKEIAQNEGDLESSRGKIEELRSNLIKDTEKKEGLNNQIEFWANLIEDWENDLEFQKSQLNRSFEEEGTNKTRLSELDKEYTKLREITVNITDRIRNFREARSELEEKRENIDTEKKELTNNLDQIKEQKSEFLNKFTEIKVKSEDLVTRFEEDFNQDFETEEKNADLTEFNEDDCKREFEEKDSKLLRMGEVNLLAISEYEEVSSELEKETTSRDDLIGSKENILKIIKKIDHDSKVKFLEVFDQIRSNFQYIFNKLFGEGDSDIYLLDEENVLDCGIDIYVKPKGKQPKVINLLSGGEKALTAAALLLAIFMIKPSPFCLLDEVDAALDDANIERFFSLLREFSEKTQFIIITHNKKTMEYSDAIYGVTMQEVGVSKIISAKFTDEGTLMNAPPGDEE